MGKSQSKDRVGNVQQSLNLTNAEVDSMLKQFFQLTKNHRMLTREQFCDFIRMSRQGQENGDAKHWEVVFDMLDLNGDGKIDFYEWSISMVYSSKLSVENKIDYIFQIMDFNKDGSVNAEELRRAFGVLGRQASKYSADALDLREYFPTLEFSKSIGKNEFKEALMSPKGRELMSLINMDL